MSPEDTDPDGTEGFDVEPPVESTIVGRARRLDWAAGQIERITRWLMLLLVVGLLSFVVGVALWLA